MLDSVRDSTAAYGGLAVSIQRNRHGDVRSVIGAGTQSICVNEEFSYLVWRRDRAFDFVRSSGIAGGSGVASKSIFGKDFGANRSFFLGIGNSIRNDSGNLYAYCSAFVLL